LALLALAQTGVEVESEPIVARAIAYLHSALPKTHAPISLAWGVLGLRAWGRSEPAFDDQLTETYRLMTRKPTAPSALALLLLAADDRALALFGITRRDGSLSHA